MKFCASLLVIGLCVQLAGAALIVEDFDYGDAYIRYWSSQDPAPNGGQGWDGPWAEPNAYYRYTTPSLNYTVDGYVSSDVGGKLVVGGAGNDEIARDFATSFGSGSTLWGSCLMYTPGGKRSGRFNFLRVEINDDDDSFGFRGVNNNDDGIDPPEPKVEGVLRARINGSNSDFGASPIDDVVLFIVKLETDYLGDFDRMTVWANPTGPLSDEASLGAGNTYDGEDIWGSAVSSIAVYGRWADGQPGIDSIRFSDVSLPEVLTGVPEPTTMGLVALGAIAGLRRRK